MSDGSEPKPAQPLTIVGRAVACPRCGTAFACGASTGRCWCFERPKIPFPADATDCLCPACLDAAIRESGAGNDSAPGRSGSGPG